MSEYSSMTKRVATSFKTETRGIEHEIGRFRPFIGHEGPYGEEMNSSTLFLTSVLEEREGSASRPGRTLPPGKTRYPLYRKLGGPQSRSGQVRKISTPPGFDPRTVQPVGSSYTDYATRRIRDKLENYQM